MVAQKTAIHRMDCNPERPIRNTAPIAAPMIIQGARLPIRLRVRSLNAPTSGWAKSVKMNDTVLTMARLETLFASSMAATWLGSNTEMRPL